MTTSNSTRKILDPVAETKSSGLEYRELLRVSMDSLMANKLRTFLTMLGVIIGVASVVSLMTLGNGASNAITSQFSSLGTNNLTILPGRPNRGGPPGQIGVQPMTMTDVKTISVLKLPIDGPVPNFTNQATLSAAAAEKSGQVLGTTAEYKGVNTIVME